MPGARALHLCQCYEPLYDGVAAQHREIEAVYRLPTRKLAVSPHLVELLAARHGDRRRLDSAAVRARPLPARRPHERADDGRLRVLIVGPWELPIKGVEWGLEALRPLHDEGWLDLVRLSLDVHPAELALWPDAERHTNVAPAAVPAIYAGVDAYVGLCDEVEGFGLPALEAMGCGRPCVLTDIGAVRALDPAGAASLRVPRGDGAALRAAVRRLRDDADAAPPSRRVGPRHRRAIHRGAQRSALLAVIERELAGPSGAATLRTARRRTCGT